MSSKIMSFKAKINNYAKQHKIAAQVVLQNYMFERFLERLAKSEYKEKFVIKGGMLVASIVGLDTRATMDLDTTLRNLPLTEAALKEAMVNIISINLEDETGFNLVSLEPIRKDDIYGGFRVRIDTVFGDIKTPLSIDVSTGDVITPGAIRYSFTSNFDDELSLELWGYNIESILAEKVETILSRSIFNTRPRDFYDVYILTKQQKFDIDIFKEALLATSIHRGSNENIKDTETILAQITDSVNLKNLWAKYQKTFPYAKNIEYKELIESLKKLLVYND